MNDHTPSLQPNFYLSEVHLQNFRCFEDLKMTLHPRMNVLVGVNASGKTALLEYV
jgi:recombinational DNA repair ATPase RecF